MSESLAEYVKLWFRAIRPFSFPCSLMPALVAVSAVLPIRDWRWDRLVATLALVLGLHIAGNMLNDYFDYVSGVDRRIEDDEGRPGRLLVKGEMAPSDVLRGVRVALIVVATATAYLTVQVDGWVLAFVALALFGAYSYTGPPFRLKARGLGEATTLAFFGPGLMAGASYVQIQRVPAELLLLSIPIGLSVGLILAGNNLRDLEEDSVGGVRTLAHRIGARPAAWVYCALAVACPIGVSAVGVEYGVPWLAVSLLSLGTVIRPVRAVLSGTRLADIDVRTVKFTLVLGTITAGVLIDAGGL